MKSILILSHTRSISTFKIGSHHYANELQSEGREVSFSGVPFSFIHWVLRRKNNTGSKKTNEGVKVVNIRALLPITIKYNYFLSKVNLLSMRLFTPGDFFDKHYDVIICDTPFFEPYIKRMTYTKLIYRPTDDYLSIAGEKIRSYEERIIQRANCIVSTSNVVEDNLFKNYPSVIEGKTCAVIENGYDSREFYNKNSGYRNNAVYVGALDFRFDFGMLAFLASNRPDFIFDIFGPIDEKYRQSVEEIKRQNSNVIFHGEIDYGNVCDILNEHKIGLLLFNSSQANVGRSPMKLWEYLSSGLSVIYSNINLNASIGCLYKYHDENDVLYAFDMAASSEKLESSASEDIGKYSWQYKASALAKYF